MTDRTQMVERYSVLDRVQHWIVAVTFVLAAISGLALFHPAFFFLSAVLGGGTWSRILHPFIGVIVFAVFVAMAIRFAPHNTMTDADREWRRHFGEILRNRESGLPEIGKYNSGQKILFWTLLVTISLLLLSGIVLWQPWFAPHFPILVVRLAATLHALCAFIAILALIVHIYASYWTRGSIRAMTRGKVTAAWARHHHPAWYREVAGGK